MEKKYDNLSPLEIHQAKIEEVQDGERYSMDVKKLTKNQKRLEKAQKLAKDATKRALQVGIVQPHEVIDTDLTEDQKEKIKAEKAVEKATGYKIVSFKDLEKSDIDFINSLEENGAKYETIRELFGGRIANDWKRKERIPAVNPEQKLRHSPEATKFVELYKKNYEKIISGKRYKTDTELKKDAGYSDGVPANYVKRIPWVALKLKNFHDSQQQIAEYHLSKIEDMEVRAKSVASEVRVKALNFLNTNPDKIHNANIRDQSSMLKALNETIGIDEQNNGPSVAIQINQDMGSVFSAQNKEKEDHLNNSF